MGKRKIPERWEDYTPWGQRVAGTNFLPFKTPLSEALLIRTEKDMPWFTARMLLKDQPQVKAVINLTDTDRYYDPNDFIQRGVLYKQINIRGRIVPSEQKISEFFETVDGFLEHLRSDQNALIGVHCTHGLNRTGYLICKYMVARMKINPHEAIKDFEEARGYKMERQNYVDDILPITYNRQDTTINDNWRQMQTNIRDEHYNKNTNNVYSAMNTNKQRNNNRERNHFEGYQKNKSVKCTFEMKPNTSGRTNQTNKAALKMERRKNNRNARMATNTTDDYQNVNVNDNLEMKTNTANDQQHVSLKRKSTSTIQQRNKDETRNSQMPANITAAQHYKRQSGNLEMNTSTNWRSEPSPDVVEYDGSRQSFGRHWRSKSRQQPENRNYHYNKQRPQSHRMGRADGDGEMQDLYSQGARSSWKPRYRSATRPDTDPNPKGRKFRKVQYD